MLVRNKAKYLLRSSDHQSLTLLNVQLFVTSQGSLDGSVG